MDYISLGNLTQTYEDKQQEKIEQLTIKGDGFVRLNEACSETLTNLSNLRAFRASRSLSFEQLVDTPEYKKWEESVWQLRKHEQTCDLAVTDGLIEIQDGKESIAPLTEARIQNFVQNVQTTVANCIAPQTSFILNKVSMETTQFNMILSILSYMGRMAHQLNSSIQRKTAAGR